MVGAVLRLQKRDQDHLAHGCNPSNARATLVQAYENHRGDRKSPSWLQYSTSMDRQRLLATPPRWTLGFWPR
jgi:hypothetical protein